MSPALQNYVFYPSTATLIFIHFRTVIIFTLLFFLPVLANAQDGFDDEEVVVYLKKIRDAQGNYLSTVTKAAAKHINSGGEFKAKRYRRDAKGPVISVASPQFQFAEYKDGMSTKEMATAGLSLVSEVGSLFGFGEEAAKVAEVNSSLNRDSALLDAWGDNQQVMVTMNSSVELIEPSTGVEITRTVQFEKVYDSKATFMSERDTIIQDAVLAEIKLVLVEYIEDSEF
ncbi:hypothetical protein [Alteromonas oceanisediminis]|uniref:hypothetical protein n=1 Tax=Alteromonas oceanisediminis TaxID=2836180 RepID=UPI001BDAC61A|nr:hypothetical protein [Alteromonas oceanisediminis]MBT0586659.1 hypothetical protein [Alteromonas oceanisediminis]